MSHISENRLVSLLTMIFFVVVVISSIADITVDIRQGAGISHVVQEMVIGLLALILLAYLYRNVILVKKKNKQLLSDVAEISNKARKASQALVQAQKAFGDQIVQQFSDWEMTESESEVALLTIKGYNSKEIANLRSASEKTVRNQLSSIYRKAEVNGKHAFVAWFLDGLL